MDDLLDLSWEPPAPAKNKETKPDAFASLFSSLPSTPVASSSAQSSSSLSPSMNKVAPHSSFDDILHPFGFNKKESDNRAVPLNQLRQQSTLVEQTDMWNFDLMTTANDPFDMDSLIQQTRKQDQLSDDDNPLGVLAEPVNHDPLLEPVDHGGILEPVNRESILDPTDEYSGKTQLEETSESKIEVCEDDYDMMLIRLVDIGFSLREAKFALEATQGQDIQAAIDLLLQNSEVAHRSQLTTPRSNTEKARRSVFDETSPDHQSLRNVKEGVEAFQQQTEKVKQQAQELGGLLFKNASSFLKQSRDKVSRAVEDWQEQQKSQRTHDPSAVRPRWMTGDGRVDLSTTTPERFADDEDSESEMEIFKEEKRKMEAMRNHQKQPQRQPQRQPQKQRQAALIQDEDVYVSPSRRRGSPKVVPRSTMTVLEQTKPSVYSENTSSQQRTQRTQPTQSHTPSVHSEKKRTRPVVHADPAVMSRVNEYRNTGNTKFKLGQFGEAEEAYSHAIDILPPLHDHLVLLYNNRSMAHLKNGSYKKCIEDCNQALSLLDQSGSGSTESEGVVIQWRDQAIRAYSRKAEALENLEKYEEALQVYHQLLKYEGTHNVKINQSMARCRQALIPKPTQPSTPTITISSTPVVSEEELNKSKAVNAIRERAAADEADEAEKLEKIDEVNARLLLWKKGKEHNLRSLLATLDSLLWPGAQWKGADMSDLIQPKKCKINYMKAISKVHPDKLPSDVTVEQRMLASGIFSALNEAWDVFKSQNPQL
ncbi:hypothetical protein BDB01DRAFT_854569 [Pilobolus umbonatus]|nr:hypothetical protein BDB01DRAFT_854569 [Pilobolus umbonatus]